MFVDSQTNYNVGGFLKISNAFPRDINNIDIHQ